MRRLAPLLVLAGCGSTPAPVAGPAGGSSGVELVTIRPVAEAQAPAAARCEAPVERRLVFDPPSDRFSVPSLASLGNGRYALYSYAGPPFEQLVATVDLAEGVISTAPLGPGVGPVAAPSGQGPIGVVFVAQEPNRPPYRAFFALHEPGEGQLRQTPLGDGNVQHTFPGIAIAWSAERRQWGVVWSELGRVRLARFDERGREAGRPILLAQQGSLSQATRLVWADGRWAIVTTIGRAYAVVESGDDGVVRETPIEAEQGAEPVIAWNGRRFGVLIREQWPPHRITFVAVADGEVLGRTALAEVQDGMLLTPVIHPDGDGFVTVWSAGRRAAFDDRLMVARIDEGGLPAAGYPRRLDPQEEVHQGYASIAGEGCELAISYILGDPNGNVRVAVVQGP